MLSVEPQVEGPIGVKFVLQVSKQQTLTNLACGKGTLVHRGLAVLKMSKARMCVHKPGTMPCTYGGMLAIL